MLAGGGVMREALDDVVWAAELPRAAGEAAEGWPPRLAWPVRYESEDTGAGVGDMPEEGWDVAERGVCIVGAGRPRIGEAVWHALGLGAGLGGVEPR